MAQKHNEEMISAPMTRYGKLTLDSQRRQLRSDAFTAAEWAANNPILQLGELGSEKDTQKIKVGDGVTAWNNLPYSGGGSGAVTSVNGQTGAVVLTASDVSAAAINDSATTSLTETWSANKLNSTVGDIETLLAAI